MKPGQTIHDRCSFCAPMLRHLVSAFGAILCVFGVNDFVAGYQQDKAAAKIDDQIAARMEQFVRDGSIAGAVTLVSHQGKVIHHAAVGKSDLEASVPMTSDSVFAIASMTKPVTAAAVMILWDEKKISLDEPVATYLPEFDDTMLAGKVRPKRQITVRDCLTHTNGLVSDQRNIGTLANTVHELARSELAFEPGTRWQYGPGLSVAGRIVEVVSGKSFDEFLKTRIFDPLEMSQTQ
ncbi:MAG: beta-lactamase family protein [Planctomyces sp.]|nr:beta-lactamase family protein [Planctomyces sp.]